MKMILATISIFILSSCTYTQINDTAIRVNEACKRVVPLAKIASLLPTPPAAEIASYVIMACDTSEGLAKLLADPTSEIWLNNLHNELNKLLHREETA